MYNDGLWQWELENCSEYGEWREIPEVSGKNLKCDWVGTYKTDT